MSRSPDLFLRDILAHAYFAVDEAILWDIISRKVPALLSALRGGRAPGPD